MLASEPPPPHVRLSARQKVATIAVVAILLVVAWRAGLIDLFSDPERLRATIQGLGALGYVVFVLAFAVLQAFGIPMIVFVLGASYLWSAPVAFALSLVGVMASASLAFFFARFLAHDWVRARMPPRLTKLDQRIARHAFATVILVRLIFWGNPLTHMFFGISRLSFRSYFVASLVAYAPILAVIVWASSYAIAYLQENPVGTWLPWVLGGAAVLAALRIALGAVKKRRDA